MKYLGSFVTVFTSYSKITTDILDTLGNLISMH